MNKKTTAIVVTILTIFLCGCPGLFSLLMGAMFALISFVPGANIDVFGSSDPQSALMFGIGALVLGVICVIITIIAILVAWRANKNNPPAVPQ
jgi:hypothetical protein